MEHCNENGKKIERKILMKKILVISWFYPPINSSEGLVTYKLLYNYVAGNPISLHINSHQFLFFFLNKQ